jgi:cell division protein FtsQ
VSAPAVPLTGALDPRVWRRRPIARVLAVVAAVAAVAALAAAAMAIRSAAYFRVRAITVVGTHYLIARDVAARARLDTATSVWTALPPIAARLRGLPGVASVVVTRELPGTIVVRIVETAPVALAPTPQGLAAVDVGGHVLPLDPTRSDVDLPVVTRADLQILRLLDGVRTVAPALYARISSVRRDGPADLLVTTTDGRLRLRASATPERVAEAVPVAADLARRGLAWTELDLRYRDQVVARLR